VVKSKDALGNRAYFDYTSRGDVSMPMDARNTAAYFEYNGLRLMTRRVIADSLGREVAVTSEQLGRRKHSAPTPGRREENGLALRGPGL